MKLEDHILNQSKKRIFKSAIITHKNCPDGAAASVIAKKIFPEIAVFPTNHVWVDSQVSKVVNYLQTGERLLIADICCSQQKLESLFRLLKEKQILISIFEHHESNKWLSTFKFPEGIKGEIIFDGERCGSKILYDRFLPEYSELSEWEDFIAVNNDRDLWINKHPHSVTIAKLHQILGDQAYLERFLANPKVEFSIEEQSVLRHEQKMEKRKHELLLKNMIIHERDNEGFKYGVIYGEADGSDLLNEAIERFDLEYAILANLNTKKASIRSRGNKDCVVYAEKFGGGGHRCASGFRINFKQPEF